MTHQPFSVVFALLLAVGCNSSLRDPEDAAVGRPFDAASSRMRDAELPPDFDATTHDGSVDPLLDASANDPDGGAPLVDAREPADVRLFPLEVGRRWEYQLISTYPRCRSD